MAESGDSLIVVPKSKVRKQIFIIVMAIMALGLDGVSLSEN